MRIAGILCVFVLLGTAGCPLIQPQVEFRSADVNSARGPIFAFGADDTAEGGDGGGTVREVIEPDIFRQVGNLLYVLNQFRGLSIVDLDTGELVGQAPVRGFPRDLYIAGGRAYVLTASAADFEVQGNSVEFTVGSRLAVIDIADPSNPTIIGEELLTGDLLDSRLVGDVLYSATARYTYYVVDGFVTKNQESGTTITSFNVADASNIGAVDSVYFEGTGHVVQATNAAMFVGVRDYQNDDTDITYVDISAPNGSLALGDTVNVVGEVADRFKLDAYNGVLRVVSNTWNGTRETYVTTFGLSDINDIPQLGQTRLETASGDSLFAVRFAGEKAYVVTYFRVDPFYVIDLSDPANPTVAGELEVPGWSVHLEPIDDSTLLALGVDDTDGRRVSLSLFDVSNPANPTLTDRKSIGEEWSWSLALSDVRAFSVMGDVAAVPISQWDPERGYETRVQFASFTTSEITLRGFAEAPGNVLRTFEHADGYASLSDTHVSIFDDDIDTPDTEHEIALVELTADVIPLGGGARLDVLFEDNYNTVIVRRVEDDGSMSSDTAIELGTYLTGFATANGALLVGASYEDDPAYIVVRVIASAGAAPIVDASVEVDLAPYWGYFPIPYLALEDKLIARDYVPWGYFHRSASAFLLDDALVLRGSSDDFDVVIGGTDAYEGVARVDLSDLSVDTYGLAISGITDMFQAGNTLYLTNTVYSENNLTILPTVAYYVRSLDLENATAGPRANIPGRPIDYDENADILTLHDYQWDTPIAGNFGDPMAFLRTATWDGGDGNVEIVSTVEIAIWGDGPIRTGDYVYVGDYPSQGGYRVNAWRVDGEGGLFANGSVNVTSQWGSILAGDNGKVYATVGSAAVARYDFSGPPFLDVLVEVPGYTERLRLGDAHVYIVSGYGGVTRIAR